MKWKKSLNTAMDRLGGHKVVRTKTLSDLERAAARGAKKASAQQQQLAIQKKQLATVIQRLEDSSVALSEQIKRVETLTKPKPKAAPKLPEDYDEAYKPIWPKVKERTMNTHEKLYYLYSAVCYAERYKIPGAIVECGVWRGGSMLAVAHTLEHLGVDDRELYLFDTFEGMTEPTEKDVHVWAKQSANEIRATGAKTAPRMWIPASLEDVQEGFDELDYPKERIHYVKGAVEETIPDQAPDQIAILRLDTDWYESTKHELEHLYSRLAPGGVLIIDDYGSWEGSKEATDEFLAATREPILLTRISRTRAAVKPGLPTQVPRP